MQKLPVYGVQNLWQKYGLIANPFDTSPLSLREGALLPIVKAIEGRDFETQESRILYNVLRNPGGARVLIEGNVGVGKTTFVNYHRYLWEHVAQDKLFTPEEEIAVTSDWQLSQFLSNILASLIHKLILLLGEKEVCKFPLFKEVLAYSRIVFPQGINLEASILGFGGGVGKNEQVHQPILSEVQLLIYLREMVQEIKKLSYSGVFLQIDNLEILKKQDIPRMRSFFENIRDSLQIPDVYFIFIGNLGFFRDIITPLSRVRSIFFGRPVILSPITKEQVVNAIHKRYALLALPKKKIIFPVEDAILEYLYDIYQGNLRYIMDALNMMIPELTEDYPGTIPVEKAKLSLQSLVQEQIKNILSSTEWEIFSLCCQKESFTNQMICEETGIASSNMAVMMNYFRDMNLIALIHKQGRKIFYKITQYAKMAVPESTSKSFYFFMPPQERRLEKALSIFQQQTQVRHRDYAKTMNVSLSTATRDLNKLVFSGKAFRSGKGKNTIYKFK